MKMRSKKVEVTAQLAPNPIGWMRGTVVTVDEKALIAPEVWEGLELPVAPPANPRRGVEGCG